MGRPIDLVGVRFGRLIATSPTHITLSTGRRMPAWNCVCDCGNEAIVQGHHLRGGRTLSCGCLRIEAISKDGGNRKLWPGYGVWQQMIYRCENPNVISYRNYGARGIKVCDRWRHGVGGFEAFIADMGFPPKGLTLDRIDPDGDYEPSNCRWATVKAQNRNKRNTICVSIGGVNVPIAKYAERLGVKYESLRNQVRNLGKSHREALAAIRGGGVWHDAH